MLTVGRDRMLDAGHVQPALQCDAEALPLLVMLHGLHGDHTDWTNRGQLHLTADRLIALDAIAPLIILMPDGDDSFYVPGPDGDYERYIVDELIGQVAARYPVADGRENRFIGGLSMGGYGTWALAAERPDLVAAIAPICGGGDWFRGFPARVLNLWEMPVWAFHGARDQVVPPSGSQELVALLQALGGPARLTLYPHADHDSWTETYNNPALYRWLLMQRLKPHRRPRTLETALPDGSTLRYWQGGGGCIIAPESAGLGRLVPLEAKTWQALAAERSDPRRLAQELAALGLPSELAPYVTAVQAAAE